MVATVMLRRGVIQVFFYCKVKKKKVLEDSEKCSCENLLNFWNYGESASQALLLNIIDATRDFEQK